MTRDDRSLSSEMLHDRAEHLLDWIDWLVSRGMDKLHPSERSKLWQARMRELAEVYAYADDR